MPLAPLDGPGGVWDARFSSRGALIPVLSEIAGAGLTAGLKPSGAPA
jgi:hypothetical protein